MSWGVGGRYICAVHLSRYVNLCGSYEVTQDSGYWMGECGRGWGGGSGAEAKQCLPVNSSDYFSSVLVMGVNSSPISTRASLGASQGLVYSQIFWKG